MFNSCRRKKGDNSAGPEVRSGRQWIRGNGESLWGPQEKNKTEDRREANCQYLVDVSRSYHIARIVFGLKAHRASRSRPEQVQRGLTFW